MKSTVKKFLIALVSLGIIFSGVALAHEHSRGAPGWWRNHAGGERVQKRCAARRVISKIFKRAKVETLSELSGRPLKKVKKNIHGKPCCLILEEYKIKASDYYTNLKAKKLSLLDKAEKEGKITIFQKKKATLRINGARHRMRRRGGCPW